MSSISTWCAACMPPRCANAPRTRWIATSTSSTATCPRTSTRWSSTKSRSRCCAPCCASPAATSRAPPRFSASIAAPCGRNCGPTACTNDHDDTGRATGPPSLEHLAAMTPICRALLSASDKTGIIEFARELSRRGVQILSTGGTAQLLEESGIAVTEVSAHTGFPEIMAGRVKTLHPKIHGGLLGRRGTDDAVMREHDIAPIDLLAVNLYPFEQTISRANCTLDEAIDRKSV